MKPDAIDVEDERLAWYLHNWAVWHLARKNVGSPSSYPTHAAVQYDARRSKTFEELIGQADADCGEAVEAILDDDCTPIERIAVHHFHIAKVFRFPHVGAGAEVCYANACQKIKAGMLARGLWV